MYKAKKRFRMKKNGKMRMITCYSNNKYGVNLRNYHIEVLEYLECHYQGNLCESSFAYQKGKNCKQLVEKHLNSTSFFKCDIQSFFNSINHGILLEKLNQINYDTEANKNIIDSCSSSNKGLDIGMIPSGTLANIYLGEFDQTVRSKIGTECIYTRYADDIIISSNNTKKFQFIKQLIIRELMILKLNINPDKFAIKELCNHKDYIKILGINVVKGDEAHGGKNYMTISRKFKKSIVNEKSQNAIKSKKAYVKYNELRGCYEASNNSK